MPCMKMCCFFLSTRLGSIIVGILSILQLLIPTLILVANGGENYLKTGASNINAHLNDFAQEEVFISFLRFTEDDPEILFIGTVSFCGLHLLSCILMILGALKVQKWLLLPFIILELIRLCILSLIHVIGMMVIKKQLNLGDLIAITIAGGFGLRKNCNAQQQYLYKNHVD
ncbi:AAEL008665-PA [Aedes aegypti]|uniref:AAEL008665-PA n=1 Tax=Aedes aegypti TaxID=7159 RepID=Q16Y48_AEDAE|nr:AAEL008665-PA [Aedes aegypti]